MDITGYVSNHFAQIGVIYLLIVKVLTAIQDAVDAQPKDLKPPFGKAIYYLTAVGGYLSIGNRPQPISGGTNEKSNISLSPTVTAISGTSTDGK